MWPVTSSYLAFPRIFKVNTLRLFRSTCSSDVKRTAVHENFGGIRKKACKNKSVKDIFLRIFSVCKVSKFGVFWSIFSSVRVEYGDLEISFFKSPYSVLIRENLDHENSEFGQFSRNIVKIWHNKSLKEHRKATACIVCVPQSISLRLWLPSWKQVSNIGQVSIAYILCISKVNNILDPFWINDVVGMISF